MLLLISWIDSLEQNNSIKDTNYISRIMKLVQLLYVQAISISAAFFSTDWYLQIFQG